MLQCHFAHANQLQSASPSESQVYKQHYQSVNHSLLGLIIFFRSQNAKKRKIIKKQTKYSLINTHQLSDMTISTSSNRY